MIAVTKIRLSAHDHEVERGPKHTLEPIPDNERRCRHCYCNNKNKVEDEVHFITKCKMYAQLKHELLRQFPEYKKLLII